MLNKLDKSKLRGSLPETLRYLGITKFAEVPERILEIAQKETDFALQLIEPQGIWHTGSLSNCANEECVFMDESLRLLSGDLVHHLQGYSQAVLMGITIGSQLEKEVEKLFLKREHTRAAVLDAVGSQLAEEAADLITAEFVSEMHLASGNYTRRFSPGYGDWSVDVQPQLLEKMQAKRIGLSCNEAAILIPRKSITAIIGYR